MLRIRSDIKEAIQEGMPIVALESTIISHGMPFPDNIETALSVEKIITANNAVPATIGIINGELVVGLSHEEIIQFGERKDIIKVSRRDIPVVVSRKQWGATTVAATMIAAFSAGIEIFVTGGIGGVHRGAGSSFDISADLQELARTNVTVVCAGAKAILDLPLTMEYLETFGVPVIGYGSEDFASFYSRSSGLKVDVCCETPLEIAEIISAKRKLRLDGGIVVSNPIPEEFEINNIEIEKVIEVSIKAMKNKGVKGKEVTPYLLSEIEKATQGRSLNANVKLIQSNASLGAQIACSLGTVLSRGHIS